MSASSVFDTIQSRFSQVANQVKQTATRVGRDPETVNLIVVTKAHDVEVARAVIAAGATHLGESYPEEGAQKIAEIQSPDLTWHMIGHIQSRKARLVAQNYAWVQSLDSLKLARRLDRFAGDENRTLPVLLECNISGEETKFGFEIWDDSQRPAFEKQVAEILDLPHLQVRGLMTVPPWNPDPEGSRPYFQKLCRLQTQLRTVFPAENWGELSMGMSNDFQVAIEEGATMVRVGTAIVGPRQP